MKNVILFDVGGVLLQWKDEWLFDEISHELDIPFEEIKDKFNANISELFIGKISEEQFWNKISDGVKINHEIISQTFLKRSILDTKVLNLARSIKKQGFDIGILSNITPETRRILPKQWIDEFDHVFFSDQIKLAKPDPKIFSYIKEKLSEHQIVFIDDKQENVDAAKRYGIKSILFEEYQSLSEELAKQILVAS
ncbi:MAG: HAD family hydrolase [Candidatus Nitrosopumilus sp. bin_6a]